jgi:hypothetical protein
MFHLCHRLAHKHLPKAVLLCYKRNRRAAASWLFLLKFLSVITMLFRAAAKSAIAD